MASTNKIFAAILIMSILFHTSNACNSKCKPSPAAYCPRDTLKLGVCVDVLGLVNLVVGSPPTSKCCALLEGLADLEAALCLCTALKANVLGVNINVPVALSVLVSACQKTVPPGFTCK
ncbi:14 kDa proline-rich protein DC2.15-like [Humulus lupulus]|uniref:14 kDa proline-rich protein DC2.15-like n=1 Tax=Humulus lupulus TaxID=3486 RepID=UPI002B40CDC5|nr:14 kDa proline-rich protein DC2.15-like [Humulus lupulus]